MDGIKQPWDDDLHFEYRPIGLEVHPSTTFSGSWLPRPKETQNDFKIKFIDGKSNDLVD